MPLAARNFLHHFLATHSLAILQRKHGEGPPAVSSEYIKPPPITRSCCLRHDADFERRQRTGHRLAAQVQLEVSYQRPRPSLPHPFLRSYFPPLRPIANKHLLSSSETYLREGAVI